MADLVSEWLAANYPQHNLNDATRLRLLELVGAHFSYLALPDLWRVYMKQQRYMGALSDQFAKMYTEQEVDTSLRTPFSAIVAAKSLTEQVQDLYTDDLAGVMYDMTLASNLFQDSARTIPVSAVSDPIGSATDLSGNNLHASIGTDSKRPIFNNYATFDGIDDALSVASLNLSSTDKITIVALLYWNTVTPTATIAEFSAAVGVGNPGSFAMQVEGNPYPLRVRLAGNSAVAVRTETTPIPAVPRASVVTISFDIAGADIASEIGVRVNGANASLVSTGTTAGGGNFGNYAFYLAMRAAASLPWPGRIYRFAIFGKALSASELQTAEAWAGEPLGLFL